MKDSPPTNLIHDFFEKNSFSREELDKLISRVKKQCKSDECLTQAQREIRRGLAKFNLKKSKKSALQMSRRARIKSATVLSSEDRLFKLLLNARITKAAIILKLEERILINQIKTNSGQELKKTSRLNREIILGNADYFLDRLDSAKEFNQFDYEKKPRKKLRMKGGSDAWGRLWMTKNVGPLIYIRSK